MLAGYREGMGAGGKQAGRDRLFEQHWSWLGGCLGSMFEVGSLAVSGVKWGGNMVGSRASWPVEDVMALG